MSILPLKADIHQGERARREIAWLAVVGLINRLDQTPVPPKDIVAQASKAVLLDPSDGRSKAKAVAAPPWREPERTRSAKMQETSSGERGSPACLSMRFAMWVIVLRAALLAAVLTGVCISPSALAAELLACQAKDAVNLQKDGTLEMDSVAQRAAQGSLVIDLSSGEVRSDGEQASLKMTARQHGNETVLVPSLAPEFVRNVIRVHQTAGQIVFSQYILDLFISGTCAPIQ